MKWKSLVTILLLAASAISVAAQNVYVSSASDDIIGQRFAFAFKEAVRKSATWNLAATPASDFRVELVSINPDSGETEQHSAISVTIEFEGISEDCKACRWPLDHEIYIVGGAKVDEMSGTLLAKLDEIKESIRQALANSGPKTATPAPK